MDEDILAGLDDTSAELDTPLEPEHTIEPGEDRPLHIRLRHDSSIHATLISWLKEMIEDGESHMEQRFEAWDIVDEHMRLYVDLRRGQRKGDRTFDDDKKENPFERDQYAVSSTYVNVMTRTDHIYTMLTQADPFIHLEAREGGDYKGARIHEAALRYDAEQSKNPLQVWQMAYDATRYQTGTWFLTWEEEYHDVLDDGVLAAIGFSRETLRILEQSDPIAGREIREKATRRRVKKQYNRWRCIDPRRLLPDPSRSMADQAGGQFSGFWEVINWLDLHERRIEDRRGPYFNVERARRTSTNFGRNAESRNVTEGSYDDTDRTRERYPNVEAANMFVRLIPYDYGLSESRNCEIWWFTVINREVIVRAHKLPFGHGEIPIFTGEAELDMHSAFAPSVAEQNIGFQNLMTWLITSHVTSTKRFTNDGVIVNDDLISLVDLMNPEPGRMVRLTKQGKLLSQRGLVAIDQMYSQPKIQDVTGSHMDLAMKIGQMSQEMMATPPPVTGVPLPTKRTLGEIENSQAMASLRLGVVAQMLDEQIIGPMAACAVQNLQQFSSMERVLRLGGRLITQMMQLPDYEQQIDPKNPLLRISPNDYMGEYDYIARTPTMAKDPTRSAALWGMVLQTLMQFGPQAMQPDPQGMVINPHAVFNEYLRALGITYFDNFRMPAPPPPPQPKDITEDPANDVSVLPPEEMQRQAQAGNLVPVQEMAAARGGIQ